MAQLEPIGESRQTKIKQDVLSYLSKQVAKLDG